MFLLCYALLTHACKHGALHTSLRALSHEMQRGSQAVMHRMCHRRAVVTPDAALLAACKQGVHCIAHRAVRRHELCLTRQQLGVACYVRNNVKTLPGRSAAQPP